jgi:predicted YcjX-like family ATPase
MVVEVRSMERRPLLLVVGLAMIEVAIFEAMIRLGIVGVARAGETLFILLLLNFGFVQVLRRRH